MTLKFYVKEALFEAKQELLTSVSGSALEAFFSNRHNVELRHGLPYISRDPKAFKLLLDYLNSDFSLIEDPDFDLLLEELDYWGVISSNH